MTDPGTRFADLPDYILGITKEIWEDRGVSTLRRYYDPDVVVRAASGVTRGNEDVIAATMSTLVEFPDRQLLGEDVIWCGNSDDGFLSSHRLIILATHTVDGAHGKAVGAKLAYRVIGDCAVADNVIFDEWVVRDQGAVAAQLGTDAASMARSRLEFGGGADPSNVPLTPHNEPAGTYRGFGNEHRIGIRYESLLNRIMDSDVSAVRAEYDRACHLELPGGVTGHGCAAAERFWIGLRSAVPRGRFTVHHRIGMNEPRSSPRAALRWSLSGSHDGWGRYGRPTGADVHIMGISHAEFGPRGLRREYVVVDDVAVWQQILA